MLDVEENASKIEKCLLRDTTKRVEKQQKEIAYPRKLDVIIVMRCKLISVKITLKQITHTWMERRNGVMFIKWM